MAKTFVRYFLAGILICHSFNCLSQPYSDCRAAVIENYKSQIHVREKTGNNDGEDVEKYLKTVGLGKGYAWCAAFVKWCLTHGVYNSDAEKYINGMALSLHRKEKIIYFKGVFTEEPQHADVFNLWYNSLGRIGHTGFYHGWADKKKGNYYSYEGNATGKGARESEGGTPGQGVWRLIIRNINNTYSITKWIGN